MYCAKCGKQLEPGARFCSACGTAYDPSATYQSATQPPPYAGGAPFTGQLTRLRHPRAIAGVCSGLAAHYGWDVTMVRLIWLCCILFAGTGVLAYIIAWIVIPEAPYALQPPPPPGYTS